MKRIAQVIVALAATLIVALALTGNMYLLQGIRKTYLVGEKTPDIDDMEFFDVRKIARGTPHPHIKYSRYNELPFPKEHAAWRDSMETSSFLVFWRDSLLFEEYREGDTATVSNSFSIAKSITAILIGCAIDDGYIRSVDQPVSDFLPEFTEGINGALTVRHLLEMTSGIPFGESYNSPFGYMAKAYFGSDLKAATMRYRVGREPGTLWAYEGGNTALLGMILQRATGKTPSEYCQDRVWSKLGAEGDAFWNLDRADGLEKSFSGFYATPRDFARLGMLFMHGGVWGSDTLLSSSFVERALIPIMIPDEKQDRCDWYGWHWWLGNHDGLDMFLCRGLRGQYIVCIPDLELIMVRTGHLQSKERVRHMPADLYRYIDIAIEIMDKHRAVAL